MPQCRKATEYAVRIAEAKNLDDLRRLAVEIKANVKEIGNYREWLLDIYYSRELILTTPDDPDFLNAEGKKWLRRTT